MQEDKLIRTPAVAKVLGVCARTVLRWRQKGLGPRFVVVQNDAQPRGSIWYKTSDVIAFRDGRHNEQPGA